MSIVEVGISTEISHTTHVSTGNLILVLTSTGNRSWNKCWDIGWHWSIYRVYWIRVHWMIGSWWRRRITTGVFLLIIFLVQGFFKMRTHCEEEKGEEERK